MSPDELEMTAKEIERYLQDSGAVRVSETEVADYKTVEQICDDLHICDGDFRRVKAYMRKRKVPISYIPNKGHFIGWAGEQVTDIVYKFKVSAAHARNLKTYTNELENASPNEKQWINRRFKDFTTIQEVQDEHERYDPS
jgi:hypothetical protein